MPSTRKKNRPKTDKTKVDRTYLVRLAMLAIIEELPATGVEYSWLSPYALHVRFLTIAGVFHWYPSTGNLFTEKMKNVGKFLGLRDAMQRVTQLASQSQPA